jgi:cytochrome c
MRLILIRGTFMGNASMRMLFVATRRVCLAALLAILTKNAFSAADPAIAARAFEPCAACHSIKPGENLTGPSLARIWGQKAGTAKGFPRYSDALKNSRVVWDENTLELWLIDPQRFIPGNSMTFPGVKEGITRGYIISYLRTVSEGKAPAPTAQQGGMTMRGAERINLKKAAADAQVTSLTRCGDTYTLKTAKGAPRKIWEFNVRLKTDSSEYGPFPGKPVITGSGMMGDRSSIVFASPVEISSFIKENCN